MQPGVFRKSDSLRIVVVSDTHGNTWRLQEVLTQQPKADMFIHLGDGVWDVDEASPGNPARMFLRVSGNCDFGSDFPSEGETVAEGKRIFYTHGHLYYVKFGMSRITDEAVSRGADILLFGHTHVPVAEYTNGLYIMNPGSLGHPDGGNPTYGVIDITPAGIVPHIVEV